MAIKPKPPLKAVVPQGFPPTAPMPFDTYVPGDALPVPDVIEKDSDSVWALWSDAVKNPDPKDEEPDDRFTKTQPLTQLMDLEDLPKDPDA